MSHRAPTERTSKAQANGLGRAGIRAVTKQVRRDSGSGMSSEAPRGRASKAQANGLGREELRLIIQSPERA